MCKHLLIPAHSTQNSSLPWVDNAKFRNLIASILFLYVCSLYLFSLYFPTFSQKSQKALGKRILLKSLPEAQTHVWQPCDRYAIAAIKRKVEQMWDEENELPWQKSFIWQFSACIFSVFSGQSVVIAAAIAFSKRGGGGPR